MRLDILTIRVQTLSILERYSSNPILNDAVVPDILRHNRWDTVWYIVGSMELTTKRSCLNIAPTTSAYLAEGCAFPIHGQRTNKCITCHTRFPLGWLR